MFWVEVSSKDGIWKLQVLMRGTKELGPTGLTFSRLPRLLYPVLNGSFRKYGVPYFGVLIIRILLFRVLYQGPLFSETPKSSTLSRQVFRKDPGLYDRLKERRDQDC